jgi:predicted Zn-dependent protease
MPHQFVRQRTAAANVVVSFRLLTKKRSEVTANWQRFLMDRISALNEVLTQSPNDAFARYGLAMEYSKQGDLDRALAEFSILLEHHPDYTAGYFMAAQTLAKAERSADARKMLEDGIVSARRTGNLHAQSEMEAMLQELG